MTNIEHNLTPNTRGLVLHGTARYYDVLVWLFMRGREDVFREKVLDLVNRRLGESVLDVGCGTGTLAIAAERRVGPMGTVRGIDASPEMIARADKKAKKSGVGIVFKNSVVEALPFPDKSFDVVLSTLMLHHLPAEVRKQCASEMRRVLKPGGRVLAVDFAVSGKSKGLVAYFHRRHGSIKLDDMIAVLNGAGFNVLKSGPVGMKDIQFVLGTAP